MILFSFGKKVHMKKKRFSEYNNYKYDLSKDTWFNPVVEWDSKLFIDPLLLKRTNIKEFKNCYQELIDFFKNACITLKTKSIPKKLVENMLNFREVEEAQLGYSYDSNKGSGFSGLTALKFFENFSKYIDLKIFDYDELEEITLFEENVDLDRITDMILSITKRYFITYSCSIGEKEGFPLDKFNTLTHFNFDEMSWISEIVELPYIINNENKKVPVLLVPHSILVGKLHYNSENFITWLWNNETDYVKDTFEYNIKKELESNKKEIIEKIIENNDTDLFKRFGNEPVEPYDLQKDKDIINKIYDFVKDIIITNKDSEISVLEMADDLIRDIEHAVQDERGWTLLLSDTSIKFRAEPIISKFSHLIMERKSESLGFNLDISPETNKGRGPVDFKLSRGKEKVLIEIKTSTHPDLMTCIEDHKQLHQYMKQESCKDAILLVFYNKESDLEKINELHTKVAESNKRNNHNMMIRTINCIPGPSASNL